MLTVEDQLALGLPETTHRTAVLSEDGLYRYTLTRRWGAGRPVVFVMLNPSTADAEVDDPTIRRCVGFARREGCGTLEVVNLFAWRATDPLFLPLQSDPVGPHNDEWIRDRVVPAKIVIAAWGARGDLLDRADAVKAMLPPGKTFALGFTKDGHPKHPLYLSRNAALVPMEVSR